MAKCVIVSPRPEIKDKMDCGEKRCTGMFFAQNSRILQKIFSPKFLPPTSSKYSRKHEVNYCCLQRTSRKLGVLRDVHEQYSWTLDLFLVLVICSVIKSTSPPKNLMKIFSNIFRENLARKQLDRKSQDKPTNRMTNKLRRLHYLFRAAEHKIGFMFIALEALAIMRYTNLRFTYLLT